MSIDNIETLTKFDLNKQLVFCYLTCERLYPNYTYFSDNYKFGNKKSLRNAIDFIYNNLLTNNFDESFINRHLKYVNSNIPKPEKFDTVLASSALDACTAILETLDFMLDKDSTRLNDISSFATDTIDMFIQEKYNLDFNKDQDFEQTITNHPLMQKELSVQKGIINYLAHITNIEISDIDNLLSLQANNNKSNIDL